MKTKTCPICNKILEGFSDKDIEYRMLMHNMTHKKIEKQNQIKVEDQMAN